MVALFHVALTFHGTAHGEPSASEPEVWNRSFALEAVAGLGTPVGYGGFFLDFAPAPVVVLSLGAGLGSGTETAHCERATVCNGPLQDRIQLAIHGRFRVLRSRPSSRGGGAITLGVGTSSGGYSWDNFTIEASGAAHKSIDRAYWANADLGVEARWMTGLSVRAFFGYGRLLNPAGLNCVGSELQRCRQEHSSDGQGLLYLGLGVGEAF